MPLTHVGTVALVTPRLALRRLRMEDAGDMFRNWAGDAQVARYVTWQAHRSEEDSRAFLEGVVSGYDRPDRYNWGIVFAGDLIGTIGVVRISEADGNCEVGYCLGRRWWGQGIAAEALGALCDFLFGQVGFHRIAAVHDPANPASGRVMQKAGMTCEGTLRQQRFIKGRFVDAVVYSILRDEWEERA
ncbi:MAG TPA: GNAT family N-acetyltransferase [Candidatus Pullichristensenella avicola]|nr:GNAT family N-acetyltransferase [Candidatus Pullichristensenella avicola]